MVVMVAFCHDFKERQREAERDDSERLRGFDNEQTDRHLLS